MSSSNPEEEPDDAPSSVALHDIPRVIEVGRIPQHPRQYCPSTRVVLELLRPHWEFDAGHRGWLDTGRTGSSSFDWHNEVPIEGFGVPIDAVAVVERDSGDGLLLTPYIAWCRKHGLDLKCRRCGEPVVTVGRSTCPAMAGIVAARQKRAIDPLRDLPRGLHAGTSTEPFPVLDAPGPRRVRVTASSLERAQELGRVARQYYEDVAIVPRNGMGENLHDVCVGRYRDGDDPWDGIPILD